MITDQPSPQPKAHIPQPRIDFSYHKHVPRHICFLICGAIPAKVEKQIALSTLNSSPLFLLISNLINKLCLHQFVSEILCSDLFVSVVLCPIHVLTFKLISNLATEYIQKRRGEPGLFSFEYNLSPKLIPM